MRNRTHIACAARFRTVVVTLVSRVVSKMCAMANMVLILSCSCHAMRRRAHMHCMYAGARMATLCTGVCVTVSTCTCALRCVRVALYLQVRAALRHRCVTTARRIICVAWMLEYLAARHSSCLCLSMRALVSCLCAIVMRDSVVCRSSVS
jgi:hypothetical protein